MHGEPLFDSSSRACAYPDAHRSVPAHALIAAHESAAELRLREVKPATSRRRSGGQDFVLGLAGSTGFAASRKARSRAILASSVFCCSFFFATQSFTTPVGRRSALLRSGRALPGADPWRAMCVSC